MDLSNYNKIILNKKKNYNSFQYKYYYNYYNNILNKINKNSKVLEVGPGNLSFIEDFIINKVNVNNIYVCDISKGVVNGIKEKNILNKNNIILGDFLEINMKFDLIIFRHVFEHFSKDYTEMVIKKINGLMLDGGEVLIEVPNGFNLFYGLTNFSLDFTHSQVFSEKVFEQIFKMYFNGNYKLNFYGLDVIPYKISFLSLIGLLFRKIISFVSYVFIKIYIGSNIGNDFLLCKLSKND